jgi:hypothetical protein
MKTVSKAFVLGALLASSAWPQSGNATVSGSVRDQSGAYIPAAAVTLRQMATAVVLKTTTNEVGFYMFPGVVPGPYQLSVEAAGMQKFEGTLVAQVQQSVVVDVTLKVGQTGTEVTVLDVTPMVTTDNPTLGHVLERERIEQLPINGRNVGSLLQTVPGMEGNRAYGQKTGTQDMLLDGASIGDRLWGYTSQRRPPGLDTIQEFKVENNNSSAKLTRPVTVILATRAGSNQLHGAAFETARNNAIGVARSRTDTWTTGAPKYIRNEFGASSGGPVWLPKIYNGRNRTFWFFSYEGYRYAGAYRWNGAVPTQAMRNGDMRGLVDSRGNLYRIYDPWTTNTTTWERQPMAYGGQVNVIDPKLMSPLAKQLLDITPLPTLPEVSPMLDSNWWGVGPDWSRQWTISTRIDHRFTDNDRFFARYTKGGERTMSQDWNLPYAAGSGPLNGVPGTVRRIAPNQNLALSYVKTFSPVFFNELLASAAKDKRYKGTGEPGVKYADMMGLPNPMGVPGWPGIYDAGLDLYWETDNTQDSPFSYFIVDDNATRIRGRHEFQFGFHWRGDRLNILPDQQQPQGNHSFASLSTTLYDPTTSRTNPGGTPYTGSNLANFYLGLATYSNQFVRGYYYARGREWAGYFQDNYKMTPRLTLNLGLRYEFFPAYKEKNNFMSGFDFGQRAIVLGDTLQNFYRIGATLPVIVERFQSLGAKFITYQEAGLPQKLMHDDYRNFGPRLGLAYRVGDGVRSFVVRTGYRLSYFPLPVRSWGVTMRSNTPFTNRFYGNSPNSAARSPDGIANYLMRSVPTVVAGVNSRDVVSLSDPKSVLGITRGSATSLFFDPHQPTSRAHDWNFTLEKEVMQNTVVRAAYVGNAGRYLDQTLAFNSAVPDMIWYVTTGLPLPTGEYSAVARRSWDQTVYGGISRYQKSGYSNYHGWQLEFERRYTKGYGFQVFYVGGNPMTATGMAELAGSIPEENQYLPGAVPTEWKKRNDFLNYQRDTSIPHHRVRWNWIVDLPFGKGKPLLHNAGGVLNRIVGGWQVAGMGSWGTRYITLPTGVFPNFGTGKIEIYDKKYPIGDCTSGTCYPAYLWWNGYLPADKINSVDPATGKPNGYMGIPANYKPAAQPIWPWPVQPNRNDPMYPYYGTNTVWIPLKNGTVQRLTYNDNLPAWRNQYIRGPASWNMDASLFKTVPLAEGVQLRLNGDFFNVLNRPGTPNAGSNGILSMRSSALTARQIQLTVRLIW